MNTNTQNYYDILGVPKNASHKTIRKAYRRLMSQYSPLATERTKQAFKNIETAYSVLSNKEKRAEYNKYLKEPKKTITPFMSISKMFDSFFDMDPFEDFFGYGLKKKPSQIIPRNFFDFDTDPSSEEEKDSEEPNKEELKKEELKKEEPKEEKEQKEQKEAKEEKKPINKSYTKSYSTTSSTVIKNGVRTTKTKEIVVGNDGKKDVKIIEEVEGKDGKVKRIEKHLENGKEVKALTTEEDSEISPMFGRMYTSTYKPIYRPIYRPMYSPLLALL